MQPTVSDEILAYRANQLVDAMENCRLNEPLSAIYLAAAIGVAGNRENQRRRVREAMTYAREKLGQRICANGRGYWIARDATEWQQYQDAAGRGARFAFVSLRRRQAAVTERFSGQGLLFEVRPIGW